MKIDVHGYPAFLEKIKELQSSNENFLVLFTGSVDPNSGKSWCQDCVVAEPIVDSVISKVPDISLLRVFVGGREFWKSSDCPFRTNPDTRLKSIPTLLKWKKPVKLDGTDILNSDLITMLVES